MRKRQSAFTLAEVLITLGIIGVVAAMTLPTLIQNHQKQTYVAGLQKAMSTTSNMFKKMQADEGVDFYNTKLFSEGICEWGYGWDNNSQQIININGCEDFYGNISIFENIIPKYLKVVKTCKGDTECNIKYTATDLSKQNNKYVLTNSSPNRNAAQIFGSFITGTLAKFQVIGFYTNDGMVYYIFPKYNGIGVLVDINGEKGPNTLNRDLFIYFYNSNGLIENSSGTKYLMSNGWKMDY